MPYRRKVALLSCVAALLACAYVLSLVFDPERSGRRSDTYAWLDLRLRDSVDRIDFNGGESGGDGGISLVCRNGRWLLRREGREYPAREARVEELLDLLSRRASYPRRSASTASHALFGLSETVASRITLRGGAGLPLLDLLIGRVDAGGGSLYMRKAGSNEVRSGDGGLSAYIDNEARSWYDLRLFPEGAITLGSVQRLTVIPPAWVSAGGEPSETAVTMLISREGNRWRIDAGARSPGDVETSRVDSYVNGILNMTGDDVVPSGPSGGEDEALILELGDGRVVRLRLGLPLSDDGDRPAWVLGLGGDQSSGYALAPWALDRIFRTP
ncbi:MAG: DUF4340 domain-containing protein, partial [Treponema sp.]|nr:DUF4340 domain-containing protein [Treponema sp.]